MKAFSSALVPGMTGYRGRSSFAANFKHGEDGFIYLPGSRINAPQYVDNNGLIEVTPDSQVGFVIDSSRGGIGNLGQELVKSHDFSSANFWSPGGFWNIDTAAKKAFKIAGGPSNLNQPFTDTANAFYRAGIDIDEIVPSTGNITMRFQAGSSMLRLSPIFTTPGKKRFLFQGAGTTDTLRIVGGVADLTCTLDSVSLKLVPGNHAHQETALNRPILKNSNGWYWQLNGTSHRFHAPGLSLTQPFTLSTAVRLTDVASQTLISGVTGTPARVRINSSKQIEINAGSAVTGATLTLPRTVIVSAVFDGANSRVRINGGSWTSGDAGSGTLTQARIFSNAAGTGEFMSDRCYWSFGRKGSLSDSDLNKTEQELAGLAGITP